MGHLYCVRGRRLTTGGIFSSVWRPFVEWLLDVSDANLPTSTPHDLARLGYHRVRRYRQLEEASDRHVGIRDELGAVGRNIGDLAFMAADIAFDRNPCVVTSHFSDGRAWSLLGGHMLTFVGKAS
jgi:hypothetical protein